jgi:general secretion pathway protein J
MMTRRQNGFTLAEVLVASTISGFVTLVAVGALKAVGDSAGRVNRFSETTSELRFAARMMARDLANLYRDLDVRQMKLVGASQTADTAGPAFLTFYTVGRAKARADQPEGDVYEVEYILGSQSREETSRSDEEAEKSILFRRLWPNPDRERSPGGILTPVAENIDVFQVRFYDGQEWIDQWTEEMQSLPQLLEVTLAVGTPEDGSMMMETFLVNFARLQASASPPPGEGEPGQPQEPPPEGDTPREPSGEQPAPSR